MQDNLPVQRYENLGRGTIGRAHFLNPTGTTLNGGPSSSSSSIIIINIIKAIIIHCYMILLFSYNTSAGIFSR